METIKQRGKKWIKKYWWVLILLVIAVWFIFRKVEDHYAEDKATIEYIKKERDNARAEIKTREQDYKKEKDSLLNQLYYESNKIKERIETRKIFITRYLDSASVAEKFRYVDSLLGR
jgi:flagellar biosynthesis/type III secretory pathway M-ring protein FliF/YscJ